MEPALQELSSSTDRPRWATLFIAPLAQALSPIDHVLAGMVAAGQGLEAIGLYLGMARDALFDRIVALGLATPHDRPMRPPAGKRPWQVADVQTLIRLWVLGVRVVCIAEQIGRSPGAVSSKARRLGLPRRDRKQLIRLDPPQVPATFEPTGNLEADSAPPALIHARNDEQQVVGSAALEQRDPPSVGERGLRAVLADAPAEIARQPELPLPTPQLAPLVDTTPAPVPRKGHRVKETAWTRELDLELSMRAWALQHYKAIARDMRHHGIGSDSALVNRLTRLQIPGRDKKLLAETYDEALAQRRIKEFNYELRTCSIKKRPFWAHRTRGNRYYCDEALKSAAYRNLMAGIG